MSHICVTDTSAIAKDDYTMMDLHLNPEGKKSLMLLISEKVIGGHASGISSIPVLTHGRVSPFFFFFAKI